MKLRAASVGMKLFVIFFTSILALVVALGLISYIQSKTIIQHKITSATMQTMGQSADKTELVLQYYEDLTTQLMTDPALSKDLSALNDASLGELDKLDIFSKLSDNLMKYTTGKNLITSLDLIPLKPGLTFVGTTTEASSLEFDKLEWFNRIVQADGAPVWLPPVDGGFFPNGISPHFGVGRIMKNAITGSKDYVVFVEIPTKMLDSLVSGVKIGNAGQIEIQTGDGTLVRAMDPVNIGKKATLNMETGKLASSVESALSEVNGSDLVVFKKMKTSGWSLVASAPVAELVKDTKKIFTTTVIIAIIAMIVAGLAGYFVARMIGRPLAGLRNLMKEGENGNLTVRTKIKSKDEIGQLGESFNHMMEHISRLVQQTNESSAEVLQKAEALLTASGRTAASAREIAMATDEIAAGAASLSVEADKGSELTQAMGVQMQQVVKANANMDMTAAEVQRASERGTRNMNDLSLKTASTEQMTRSMVEKVDKLKESTSSIRKILDLLNNITKQTNILSLNATIEAARAGAAGKGFMVVADEIRKLAEQSKQSIQVVAEITDTIRKEIDETVLVLSDAYPVFQEQIHSVKEAETIFNQVRTHMNDFTKHLSDVSESVRLLDSSQETLALAMNNVSAVSEQSSATSEQVAAISNEQLDVSDGMVALAGELEGMSASLRETLSQFKV